MCKLNRALMLKNRKEKKRRGKKKNKQRGFIGIIHSLNSGMNQREKITLFP